MQLKIMKTGFPLNFSYFKLADIPLGLTGFWLIDFVTFAVRGLLGFWRGVGRAGFLCVYFVGAARFAADLLYPIFYQSEILLCVRELNYCSKKQHTNKALA